MNFPSTWERITSRAKYIARTLGVRAAAGYLRNRRVDFAEAHFILLGTKPRIPA